MTYLKQTCKLCEKFFRSFWEEEEEDADGLRRKNQIKTNGGLA